MISVFIICALAGVWIIKSYRQSSRRKYPPSPPDDPILGHLRIMPLTFPWVTFAEWGKTLGDVIYVCILGRPIIILNTAEASRDLMEKRSENYSDRPYSTIHNKMIKWGDMTVLLPYGNDFRTQRRFIHQYLNSQAAVTWHSMQTEQARTLIRNLLTSPEDYQNHVDRMSAANVMKVTYGHDVVSDNDTFVKTAVHGTSRGVAAGVPGLAFVDLFPVLQFIPSWLPGAGFKRNAKITSEIIERMVNGPYDKVKEERALGTAQPSLLNNLLEEYENTRVIDSHHEVNMKYATGGIFGAGVETSATTIMTFILMMIHNPEVMKRAQLDIDRVTKSEQLPTLDDRPNIPYIDCILKEVFRINPPAPLGLPHQSMKEDVYRGKIVPAGSMILPNIWQMMRDERHYQDPERFTPERFLTKVTESRNDCTHALQSFDPGDPSSLVFGFGRRICPGRFFADASAWLVIANILAVFDILPPVDPKTGKEDMPVVEYISGFSSKPKPFNCRFMPRSALHASLISQEFS